jgi:CRISPR-associated protein Cas5d
MIRGGDVVKFSNSIELEIRGERALFRDPLRPQTLPVPSCEALKGILGSIYWNPDFIWVPDSLRVMEPIGYTREGARTSDGSRFTNADVHCLKDVRYQLRAHFVWNEQRPGSVKLTERDEIRHFRIALRSLARGGRRWVCLGRADCPAAVRSVHFGEDAGAYDSGKAVSLGILYHSFDYTAGEPRYFNCIMESGVIRYSAQELFPLPELANKR